MIDSYEKLTLGKYMEVKAILEDTGEEIDKNVQLICCLGDYDEEAVLDLPLAGFNRLLQGTAFLMEEPKKRMVSTKYKLGGMELETVLDVESMTTGQFIDYQTFIKDDKYLVELLSVFLIPKGCKYNKDYNIIEVQKVIKDNLSILDAMSLSSFFLSWYQELSKATVTSLIRKMKKMIRKEKTLERKKMMQEAVANLERSGDCLQWLIEYRKQSESLGK
jgi:hypothetical protein